MSSTAAERFVQKFSERWQSPDPEAYRDLWHEDGWLLHPTMGERMPQAEIPGYVERLLQIAPDVRIEVDRWVADDDVVFIEWTMRATVKDHKRELPGVDRFTLRGDRAIEGVAYFDSLPIWAAFDPSMERGELLGALSKQ